MGENVTGGRENDGTIGAAFFLCGNRAAFTLRGRQIAPVDETRVRVFPALKQAKNVSR